MKNLLSSNHDLAQNFYHKSVGIPIFYIVVLCFMTTWNLCTHELCAQTVDEASSLLASKNQRQQQRLQYLHRSAQSHLSWYQPSPWPSIRQLDGETFDTFDIQKIQMNLRFDQFDFPTQAEFLMDIRFDTDTDLIQLLAFLQTPFQVNHITEDGAINPLNFEVNEEEFAVLIEIPNTVRLNEVMTLQLLSDVNFDQQEPIACFNNERALHCIHTFILPLNYQYYASDLFTTAITFQINQSGLFPSASGLIDQRPPLVDRGVGTWSYYTTFVNSIPAFTIGREQPVSYTDEIEFFPALNYDRNSVDYFGPLIENIMDYYAELYFPYPYGRFAVSTLANEASVALGAMANIMIPEDFWYVNLMDFMEFAPIIDGTIAHEIAHQYFFNWVRVNDLSQAWLSESFAEYSSVRYMESAYQNDDQRRSNYWAYMTLPANPTEAPIASNAVNESEDYFRIVYLRGSHLIYQLSQRLQDFDARLANLVVSYQSQFIYPYDMIDFFSSLSKRSPYENFDIDAFIDLFLTGNKRLEWLYFAHYIDEQTSELHFDSTVRYNDQVHIQALGFAEEDLYLDLANTNIIEHSKQGIRFDPQLLFFRTLYNRHTADIDCNGVVDGLDVFHVLSQQNSTETDLQWLEGIDQNADRQIDQTDVNVVIDQVGITF